MVTSPRPASSARHSGGPGIFRAIAVVRRRRPIHARSELACRARCWARATACWVRVASASLRGLELVAGLAHDLAERFADDLRVAGCVRADDVAAGDVAPD